MARLSETLTLAALLFGLNHDCGLCACLQMWPKLVQTAKEGGVDVIETYVFWNGHEPSPGNVSPLSNQWLFDCGHCA